MRGEGRRGGPGGREGRREGTTTAAGLAFALHAISLGEAREVGEDEGLGGRGMVEAAVAEGAVAMGRGGGPAKGGRRGRIEGSSGLW